MPLKGQRKGLSLLTMMTKMIDDNDETVAAVIRHRNFHQCPTPNWFGVEHDQIEGGEEKRWVRQNKERKIPEGQKQGMKIQMYQKIGRTIRKLAQKEMKKIGPRIKQEQKRKSMGRNSWTNFLKKESSTNISEKKKRMGQEKRGYHIRQEETKEDKEK